MSLTITVDLDEHGMLPDAYGKYALAGDRRGSLCIRSFPFEVSGIPAGAKALAWVFLDWDSTPVCGFPWIHWCAALTDIDGRTSVALIDDASRSGMPCLMQGYTSAAKSDPGAPTGYIGPCPPDRDHIYTLHVVALDANPDLTAPFWANELVGACRGHVLAEGTALLPSRA